MTRRALSTKARLDLFHRWNGVCHICGCKIAAGQAWEAEHVIPLAQGGEDGGDNLRPAHVKCHASKTAKDATGTARAKRREAGLARIFRAAKAEGVRVRIERRPDGVMVIEQLADAAEPAPVAPKRKVVL